MPLTDKQVLEDAGALVNSDILAGVPEDLTYNQEVILLLDAARVLSAAAKVLIEMVETKPKPTVN